MDTSLSDGLLYFLKFPLLILIYMFLAFALRSIARTLPSKEELRALKSLHSGNTTSLAVPAPEASSASRVQPRLDQEPPQRNAPSRERSSGRMALPSEEPGNNAPTSDPMPAVAPAYVGWLEVVAGLESPTKRIPIDGELLFGRSKECHVRLPEAFVSSKHARLYVSANGPILEDLDSRNGTYFGAKRLLRPVLLHEGDSFSIGDCVFCYHKQERQS